MPQMSETPQTAIPLTVLTGFLGSGKTTLLKRLINDPAMAGTAVIINEFGEVGIDDALVEKVDDDAVLLPGRARVAGNGRKRVARDISRDLR